MAVMGERNNRPIAVVEKEYGSGIIKLGIVPLIPTLQQYVMP